MKKKSLFGSPVVAIGLAALALLLVAGWGISQALQGGWGRRFLLARLSASFGRPVDAGGFALSLIGGPSLEADGVTVAEDPRFGQEYFLRADQLTATLSWSALLRGRVEFGTLFFEHPSLNLVRAADGNWNAASWLPPAPSPAGAAGTSATSARARPGHIVVDDGRINFKLGEEKILFALTAVSGRLDQDSSGHWNLDLQADPLRPSVALQQAGTLRVRGTVAGTSARLRPAALAVTWEDASLADALRLVSGQDYGVRGMVGAEWTARVEDSPSAGSAEASEWRLDGKFYLAGIHRWDLTARPADPDLNLIFSAGWQPGSGRLAVERCLLEMAHSRVEALAAADWSRGFDPSLQVTGSRISLDDVLDWVRAFRPGVPDELSAQGTLDLRATLAGWPLRLEQTGLTGSGAVLRLPGLSGPIRLGPLSASLHNGSLVLAPLAVSLPAAALPTRARGAGVSANSQAAAPAGVLRVEASLGPLLAASNPADWPYRIAVAGRTARAQDLLDLAPLLGYPQLAAPKSNGWSVQGPATLQLAWAGTPRHAAATPPSGALDLRGVEIRGPILNQPLLVSSAHIDFRPGQRHVKLAALQGLGATWSGTLDWDAADPVWQFDLAADRLNAADLDRWLGPRARAGFFARMLPFVGDGAATVRDAAIERLSARGQLQVAELALEPLALQKIEAEVELHGRSLVLRRAQAEVSGGRLLGDFEARLTANPAYSFRGQFDRVNLAQLTSSATSPEGRLAGLASGDFDLSAHGVGRESLLGSLAVKSNLRVRGPIFRGVDLAGVVGASGAVDSGTAAETRFRAAEAAVRLAAGVVHIDHLSLTGRDANLEAQGSVDLDRRIDLRVWSVPRGAELATAESDSSAERIPDRAPQLATAERNAFDRPEWTIGGTLDAPLVTRPSSVAGDVAASAPVLSPIPSTLPPPLSPSPARR